jgi:hypothetical protein
VWLLVSLKKMHISVGRRLYRWLLSGEPPAPPVLLIIPHHFRQNLPPVTDQLSDLGLIGF